VCWVFRYGICFTEGARVSKPLVLVGVIGLVCMLLFYVAESVTSVPSNPQIVQFGSNHMLAVNFAHADHTAQNCIACHHNYVDDTGTGPCFECHVTDPEVSPIIETQFHDLCRGCHVDSQLAGEAYGPTRRCIDCHITDDKP